MDKNRLIRQVDNVVINAKSGSFWEDTTIQDLEMDSAGKGRLLITKGWDNMAPFHVDIRFDREGKVSFIKSERELNKEFNKKYGESTR